MMKYLDLLATITENALNLNGECMKVFKLLDYFFIDKNNLPL